MIYQRPLETNVYRKTFESFLKNIPNVFEFKKLPASGENSIFIINQEVRIKKDAEKSITSQGRTMDFYFKYGSIDVDFYVFHKYTGESGGAQDIQKNNVISAINRASSAYINKKYMFFLYVMANIIVVIVEVK
ncbi:hypothetical protein [Spiroplasma clarkii]|uniref:hypothetical protein n=1 Tax=Spiroplasma clarkii TaxID=2139 RepID=UPI0011BAB49E|nr:hypothetical protein [Spiroplasma clarkii]